MLSFLWGGSFFFFKVLASELPPFTIVLGRVGIAVAALLALVAVRGEPLHFPKATWLPFILLGLLNNVIPFTLIAFAETRIDSGLAAILNATTPLFTVLVAHFLTRDEKLTWTGSVGLALGFTGAAIVVGPDRLLTAGAAGLAGEIAMIAASVIYGFAGVYARKFRGFSPLRATIGQLLGSLVTLIPLALVIDQPWTLPNPSLTGWAALSGLALLSTALAFVLYFRILARTGATNVSLVTFLVPVSALFLGWSILNETMNASAFIGMAIIALGLAFSDGRILSRARREAR